jgi:hypothetical protein
MAHSFTNLILNIFFGSTDCETYLARNPVAHARAGEPVAVNPRARGLVLGSRPLRPLVRLAHCVPKARLNLPLRFVLARCASASQQLTNRTLAGALTPTAQQP